MEPTGTIVFSTMGRSQYGFDIFTVDLNSPPPLSVHRVSDSVSLNFNGSFSGSDIIFISERTGSPQIYSAAFGPGSPKLPPKLLPFATGSLFHDRPILREHRLYFTSTHQQPDSIPKSSSALYSHIDGQVTRLTPKGVVDYSPAISHSGNIIAVASYGSRPWAGDFLELQTQIYIFPVSDPEKRVVVANRGGWPTWCGDSIVYFHCKAEDGWWSVYAVHLTKDFHVSAPTEPRRVTPAGIHAFTPAAFHDGRRIAVATRRKGTPFRHVEIFDLETEQFKPVTESLNPNLHHYNPFVSADSNFLGFHRFRGIAEMDPPQFIPNLENVTSPFKDLTLLRINGAFPTFSSNGDFIAYNHPSVTNGGLSVVKSDGSKRWNLFNGRTTFSNSWSPVENNVVFTSVGPIFEQPGTTVQVVRVSFDLSSGNVNLKTLTKEETGNNAFPACSPDGKSVVFRSGRSGYKNLYITDAVYGEHDGGYIRQITEGPWIDTMPCWSPDGKLIAFSSNRQNGVGFSIYIMQPDGTGLRQVHVADAERERINHVCFSADGKWLVFASNLGGVSAEPISLPNQFQPFGDLYLMRLDGSGLTRLMCNPYEDGTPTWHPRRLEILCLNQEDDDVCDELTGKINDPRWITTDF